MAPKVKDITGHVFGRLIVIERVKSTRKGSSRWLCRCDCGTVKEIDKGSFIYGGTISCGCYSRERASAMNRTHGRSGSKNPIYHTWTSMRERCLSPTAKSYARYGGRGIEIDKRWDSFENFLADMGERPEGGSIERIDNDGPYSPSNCRWATVVEQNNNRSDTHHVNYNGESLTLRELSVRTGVPHATIYKRMYEMGWSLDAAVGPPQRVRVSIEKIEEVKKLLVMGGLKQRDIAAMCGVNPSVVVRANRAIPFSKRGIT